MDEIKALTDIGNSERFVEQHKQDLRYCPELKKWLHWNGNEWVIDNNGEVINKAKQTVKAIELEAKLAVDDKLLKEEIIKHGKKSQALTRIKAMIKLAQTDTEIHINIVALDADPMKLNCQNGTVELMTGKLLPHSRALFITKSTTIVYDGNADCPQWLAFLNRIMGGNESKINYLQKIIGYSLTGLTKEQCLFILWGFGANGKSTFLEAIRKIMGGYAMHTPASTLLENNIAIRNDLARLRGARFVSAVEIGLGKKLDEALTKQLTGGDPITSRFLFREYFEQTPTFKLFIAANYKPEIRGTDHGIWRRIHLIPFDVIISDKDIDKDLPNKLEKELPGILAWAVKGCLEWQQHDLIMPEDIDSATREYKDESDIIKRFLEDRCDEDKDVKISIKSLYDAYNAWADENADDILTKKTFGHFLKQHRFKQMKSDSRRYWIGLTTKR